MKIAGTQFSLLDRSFEIYISGCKLHPCIGCHNPELWDDTIGEELNQDKIDEIAQKVKEFNSIIKKIAIYGGEPLEQPTEELVYLLNELRITNKEIWLFTRHEIADVPGAIKNMCDYIKTGKYDQTLQTTDYVICGYNLASSNQQIYKNERGIFIAQSINDK